MTYPLIMLWAHPRSMSTAIERCMRERGDLDCLHEPFLHYYYHERSEKPLPHFDSDQEYPDSYQGTREMLLRRAESSAVFAKDMSYYIMPELLQDSPFCERITHCFLIRNPMRSILSYYKLDPSVDLYEIGIEAQWQHFCGLQAQGISAVVLEAEAVQQDTNHAMKQFWSALGLDFREQALGWNQDSAPQDWQYVEGWHQQATRSTGIRQAESDPQKYQREFDAKCAESPQLNDYLEHHRPFYEKLKQYSLTRVTADETAD